MSKMKLVFEDGAQLVLDGCVRKYRKLAEMVQNHAAIVILPEKREDLREGSADFGPIVLWLKGIDVWDKRFAWEDVKGVFVNNGHLIVRARGKVELSISMAYIPNYMILVRLLAEMGRLC